MTFRVKPEIKMGLDFLSETSNRSRAYLAEEALMDYIQQNAWQAKVLQERLVEANKGIFISHKAVGTWVQALKKNRNTPIPKPDIFK